MQTRTAKEVEGRSEGKARGRARDNPSRMAPPRWADRRRCPCLKPAASSRAIAFGSVRAAHSSERVVPAQATDEGLRRAFVEAAPGEVGGRCRSRGTWWCSVGPQLHATATVWSGDRPSTTITSQSPCGREERTCGRFFLAGSGSHNADRHAEGRNRRSQLVALDGRPPGLPGGEVHSTRYFRSTLPAGLRGMSSRNSTSWGTL